MLERSCLNGIMVNTDNYSSPVPIIGLYIATASLVCFILISIDVCQGFRRKKFWLPCQFFSLNSITLTLISVSTKIPVDLTTEMPSAEDQLCKLSGTVFICITMGFLMPSIGINGEFESYANITALSIFVITVIANVSIQIATGVIFCFKMEHSIILLCMLLLLARFWLSVVDINAYKGVYTDRNKDLIRKGEQSMLRRLKVCYLHGYHTCPQFLSCKVPQLGHVTLVCIACSLILIEATLRSFVFKNQIFCHGSSDYGWSVWFMFITQTVTIVVVSLAIGLRWLTFAGHIDENLAAVRKLPYGPYLQSLYHFSLANLPEFLRATLEVIFRYVIYHPLNMIDSSLTLSSLKVSKLIFFVIERCRSDKCHTNKRPVEEFKDLLETHQVVVEQWVLRKGVEDMENWMKRYRKNPPTFLVDMLAKRPSSEILLTIGLNAGNEITCLTMLVLVEIAKVSTPPEHNAKLSAAFEEVFEVVHFIDRILKVGSFKNKSSSIYARALWKFGLIDISVTKDMVVKTTNGMVQSQFESDHALELLKEFQQSFVTGIVRDEAREIVNFIHRRSYASSKELYDHIEQLFVDMLHVFLSQLPEAIFFHIIQSPIEEYERRIRRGLEFICRFESVEKYVSFSFPSGSNIASLINAPEQLNRGHHCCNIIVET